MTQAFRPVLPAVPPPAPAPAPPHLDGVAIGCDVVEVARIRQLLTRRPAARDTLFTAAEQADAVRDGVAPDSATAVRRLAARFAAKEAVVKLLRRPALAWTDVEVRTGDDGAPELLVHGSPSGIAVSLSHGQDVAMAVVAHAACPTPPTPPTTTPTARS